MSSDIVIAITISAILVLWVVIYKFWAHTLITRWIDSKALFISRRMATATRRAEERVKMAKKSLGKVMSDRINSEKDLATAQQDLQQWQNSAQVAANQNRPDLVDKYTARQITAQTHVDQLQARFDDLVLRETQMEEALATIRGEYEKLVSLTRQLESRTAVATTKIEAAQLLSEIGKNGSADVLQAIGLVENFESQVSGNIKH